MADKMITLADGVSIRHKKKVYSGEIPESIFKDIYGKDADKQKKKFAPKEPVKNESEKSNE